METGKILIIVLFAVLYACLLLFISRPRPKKEVWLYLALIRSDIEKHKEEDDLAEQFMYFGDAILIMLINAMTHSGN